MKLSIIVPIYNVEDYISRCAFSLYNQTASREDYEVVFVNDGTKDNSIRVLRDVINFDVTPNFHIIEKINGGLSSARNYGIKYSSGDYIWFVDSDDWVDEDSVEFLLNLMEQSPDVVVMTQMYRNIKDEQTYKFVHAEKFVGSGPELLKHFPPVMAPAYICKRTFWLDSHLEFKEGILHEDAELIPRLIYTAKQIVATDRPLYHYFMRDGSITNVINPLRYDSYFVVLDSLTRFYESVVEKYKPYYAKVCITHVYGLLYISRNADKEQKRKVIGYLMKNKVIPQMMKQCPNIQSRIMGLIIDVVPSMSIYISELFWKLKV